MLSDPTKYVGDLTNYKEKTRIDATELNPIMVDISTDNPRNQQVLGNNAAIQNDVTCKMSGANLMDHEVVLGVDTTVTLRELEAGSGARKITSSKNAKQSAKFETPKFMQLV